MTKIGKEAFANFMYAVLLVALTSLFTWGFTSASYQDDIRKKQKAAQDQIEEHRLQAIEGDLEMIKRYLGSIQQTMGTH